MHDGPFVMDGLLLSDGTPTPGLAELASVIAPVRVRVAADGGSVRVENRRHTASTADVDLVWILAHDGRQVARGILEDAPSRQARPRRSRSPRRRASPATRRRRT
ncbi:hypothetical protein WDV94_13500 [Clavibacter tessellarius]